MKQATGKRTKTVFILMGITFLGIWLALLLMGQLSIIGNLAFLGAAAWLFELYSAAQRERFSPQPRAEQLEERLKEFEEEYNL
jgi:hypothetical protein